MSDFLAQVRYRGRGTPPTRRELLDKFNDWRRGKNRSFKLTVFSGDIPREAMRIGVAGIVKVYGKPGLLMLDYDTKKPFCFRHIAWVARRLRFRLNWVSYQRTVRGWHILVQCNRKFSPMETVALQAILGSDRKRETFNLCRILSGKISDNRWNLLFKEKLK